MLFMASLFGLL